MEEVLRIKKRVLGANEHYWDLDRVRKKNLTIWEKTWLTSINNSILNFKTKKA